MSNVLTSYADLIVCPACGESALNLEDSRVGCSACKSQYPVENGIPLLFQPHAGKNNVTDTVKSFYEENPFPNYDDLDSRQSLLDKARRGLFAKLLDEQLPDGAAVAEIGCGTGQLTNFLGMHWNRRVIGTDLCFNSLRLAKGFRDRFEIANAAFLQMNLFRPALRPEAFDAVISNGVLHHTGDPIGGFQSIARLVKPGGLAIIGLYNTIGRLPTDFRRFVFRVTGDRLRTLDSHLRNPQYTEARKRAWFMDQYKHPRESKHSYDEVLYEWFDAHGFDFLSSVPKIGPSPFSQKERLFEPHSPGTKVSRFLTQLDMLVRGGVDGALFIMVGRKRHAQAAPDVLVNTSAAHR